MTASLSSAPERELARALQEGRVIPILGRHADDRLEALAVALMDAFDLRLALLIGPHPQVEEALRQRGRPVYTVAPAAFGEPDPDAFYLIPLDVLADVETLQAMTGPPGAATLPVVLSEYSGLMLGMEPHDPRLEALAALWPEKRFPRPWFILTPHPWPEATAWEAHNLFAVPWPPSAPTGVKRIHQAKAARLRPQTLRLDAAAPAEVVVGDPFVLAVSVRQPDSPPLQEEDLDLHRSAAAQVIFPEAGPIKLRLRVSAPECTFDGPNEIAFRLFPQTDSPVFYFHLIPRSTGLISIVVQLFQEDEWLGGLRLQTRAGSAPAGAVTMTVTSQPLAPPAPAVRERVQSLQDRLHKLRRYVALLEEQAVVMPPGAERAALQLQIEEKKAEIVATERELDALLATVV